MRTSVARRVLLAVILASSLVVPTAPPAAAYISGDAGYQTHDWILDQAYKILEVNAGWFDLDAALAMTDDPDTSNIPGTQHVYYEQGLFGGAINRISEHYANAVRKYGQADYVGASREIGLLAHYYGDILQPYHANYAGLNEHKAHSDFEWIVQNVTRNSTDHPDWWNDGHPPTRLTNVRTRAIAAAAYSRSFYARLDPMVDANPTTLTGPMAEIVRSLMIRATNDLADIIYSVPLGAGVAPPVDRLVASVKWQYPAKNHPHQSVYVIATDPNGKPIEGLEVRFTIPMPVGSTTTELRYTDPTGKATWNGPVGASAFFAKQNVTVRATTDGHTESATTWWATTPVLATGLAGFSSTVDNRRPVVDQYVTVRSTARDGAGKPVAGLLVDWTWDVGANDVVTTGVTNASGVATSRLLITPGMTFSPTRVYAHLISGSQNRHSSAGFQRQPHSTATAYRGWFRDIWDSKFRDDIVWLADAEITAGCATERFCPDGAVTRAQMATFLVRALHLPAASRDYFTDDAGSTHEANINRLAASGITSGCGNGLFCPDGRVTRAQMASFLSRALDLPAASRDYFTDDTGSTHEANINRLAASGITSGCASNRFCPSGVVTRGQMAAFLRRALAD